MSSSDYYLIDDLIPANQFSWLAGASGAGKTTLLLQLLRDLLDGKSWFGHECRRPNIRLVYIAADRMASDYEEKMRCMGIKPIPVQSLLSLPGYDVMKLGQTANRDKMITEFLTSLYITSDRPDLLVIDPISPFFPSHMNDYHPMAAAMITISKFCKAMETTVLSTLHATKLMEGKGYFRQQDRAMGSGALQGYAGTRMMLTDAAEMRLVGNKPCPYHMLTIVPTNAAIQQIKLVRDDHGLFVPWSDFGEVTDADQVLMLIPEEPDTITTADLLPTAMMDTGKSRKSVFRILTMLQEQKLITKSDRGYYSKVRLRVTP